jgi:quinol monooxygenase YgiN
MELFIFARFQARAGAAEGLAAALREVVGPTSREAGCLAIGAFRSTTDSALFYIHSRWIDEAAFAAHGGMPLTVDFLKAVEPLLDHPLDVTRSQPLQ